MMPKAPLKKKNDVSLDDMLDKSRRIRASELATSMLSKKRAEKNGRGGAANSMHRTASSTSRITKHPKSAGPKVSSAAAKALQNNKLFTALHPDQVNIRPPPPPTPTGPASMKTRTLPAHAHSHTRTSTFTGPPTGPRAERIRRRSREKHEEVKGFSIRGSAGPVVIQASNFAVGTTSDDIRNVMASLGKILGCTILTTTPKVICEIVWEKKEAAQRCIEQYNGNIADGKKLEVVFKEGPPVIPVGRDTNGEDPFAKREEADRARREANITYQDGTNGVPPPPLYSDYLIQRGRGFDRQR